MTALSAPQEKQHVIITLAVTSAQAHALPEPKRVDQSQCSSLPKHTEPRTAPSPSFLHPTQPGGAEETAPAPHPPAAVAALASLCFREKGAPKVASSSAKLPTVAIKAAHGFNLKPAAGPVLAKDSPPFPSSWSWLTPPLPQQMMATTITTDPKHPLKSTSALAMINTHPATLPPTANAMATDPLKIEPFQKALKKSTFGSTRTDSSGSLKKKGYGENTGRWTPEEHRLFLLGLERHGTNWKEIGTMVTTRTLVQIRTHAQKFFDKVARESHPNIDEYQDFAHVLRGLKDGKRFPSSALRVLFRCQATAASAASVEASGEAHPKLVRKKQRQQTQKHRSMCHEPLQSGKIRRSQMEHAFPAPETSADNVLSLKVLVPPKQPSGKNVVASPLPQPSTSPPPQTLALSHPKAPPLAAPPLQLLPNPVSINLSPACPNLPSPNTKRCDTSRDPPQVTFGQNYNGIETAAPSIFYPQTIQQESLVEGCPEIFGEDLASIEMREFLLFNLDNGLRLVQLMRSQKERQIMAGNRSEGQRHKRHSLEVDSDLLQKASKLVNDLTHLFGANSD